MDYPEQINNDRAGRVLIIAWQDGTRQQWSHAMLRASCKCTLCQSQRLRGSAVEAADGVRVEQLHPVGAYGLQLVFSDGHEKGIYPWPYLRQLSTELASKQF
jgi:DUF971 family protein